MSISWTSHWRWSSLARAQTRRRLKRAKLHHLHYMHCFIPNLYVFERMPVGLFCGSKSAVSFDWSPWLHVTFSQLFLTFSIQTWIQVPFLRPLYSIRRCTSFKCKMAQKSVFLYRFKTLYMTKGLAWSCPTTGRKLYISLITVTALANWTLLRCPTTYAFSNKY